MQLPPSVPADTPKATRSDFLPGKEQTTPKLPTGTYSTVEMDILGRIKTQYSAN